MHARGQQQVASGQLSAGKKSFETCAQPECPSVVQSDCAKLAEATTARLPRVSFSAQAAAGGDLAETVVEVDGVKVASYLGDGKSYVLDPGRHSVRFVHESEERIVAIVLAEGETGRVIKATFGTAPQAPGASDTRAPAAPGTPKQAPEEPSRSALPLVTAGVGVAALGTGIALIFVGRGKVPSACSTSNNTCSAPPGDPVFASAKSAVGLENTGFVVAGVGLAATVGSLVWYFSSSPTAPEKGAASARTPLLGVRPVLSPTHAGVSYETRF